MRRIVVVGLALCSSLNAAARRPARSEPPAPPVPAKAARPWMNAALPVGRRAQLLLARMTLEEKFWQLYMTPGDPVRDSAAFAHGAYGVQLLDLRGDPSRAATSAAAARADSVQRFFVERTRLGIPAILFEEGVHGLMQAGATVFPQAIGLAATWDTALVLRVATEIGRQARARGVRMLLSPVVNLARDQRWGRVEETYGEDAWLAAAIGLAYVRGVEGQAVVATPKHFVANHGDGGRDSYPVNVDRATLEDLFFPPFRDAIAKGGARAVMASYNSVNGLPATASRELLTNTLRRQWGFAGVAIADAGAVGGANVLHHTTADYAESTARALRAGLDVLFQGSAHDAPLFWEAFQRGMIPAAVIDTAVARVLRLKFHLGLFERPYAGERQDQNPHVTVDADALAGVAAAESIVLLRNERGTLPFSPGVRRVALIGEDANTMRLGGYSAPATVAGWRSGLALASGGAAKIDYSTGPRRLLDSFLPVAPSMLRVDTTAGAAEGLRGEYFNGLAPEGMAAAVRTDAQVDFTWTLMPPAPGLGTDWYAVRWTGFLGLPPRAAARLAVEGDDGFRLWLDGELVVNAWDKTGFRRREVFLPHDTDRVHALRLEYRQTTGTGRIRLSWDGGISPAIALRADSVQTAQAVALAERSDAAVIVMGVEEGEFRDRASLRLTDRQEALIARVAATGKPTIVVLNTGGAVVMTPWIERVGAVVQAFYPGQGTALAVGEVLFGTRSPAGRLPYTVPRSEGQLPLVYDHLPTGRGDDYVDLTGQPLYPFGYGLSYTTFEYSDLRLTAGTATARDTVRVRFTVRNTGAVASDEVAQLYVRHETAPTAQPVLSLRGFARISLKPGESRHVDMRLPISALAVRDVDGLRRVVPGKVTIYVGASSRDIRLRGAVRIQ